MRRRLTALAMLGLLVWTADPRPTPDAAWAQGVMEQDTLPEEDLAIVVNKLNPVEALSMAELRKVFLYEWSHWPNGRRVTVAMRDQGDSEREVVLAQIYRMRDADFNRYFMQAQFTGQIQTGPKTLNTASGVCRFVFNVPGAIGYVRASEVDNSVKVVRIDGHKPGEPGYRFKLHPEPGPRKSPTHEP